MTAKDIYEYVDAEPFEAFRIQMASGRTYDVRHPENIRVGKDSVVVFLYRSEDNKIFETFKMLGLSLVESVERIDSSVSQD